jgi:hypothetical protein
MNFKVFFSFLSFLCLTSFCSSQESVSALAANISPQPGEGIYHIIVKEINKSGRIEKLPVPVYLENGQIIASCISRSGFSEVGISFLLILLIKKHYYYTC